MPALTKLSDQLAELIAAAGPRLLAIETEGETVSGFVWRTGLAVTAHEVLGGDEEVKVYLADGSAVTAELAGRDPSTDVVLLKLDTADLPEWETAATPGVGSLAVIAGRAPGSPLASFGMVGEAGPAWKSLRGGVIDGRITLGLHLGSRLEGGAVLTPEGKLLGMAVTGPRRRAIVIPATTIARAVGVLETKGYVPRGYLGVTLHPMGKGGGAIVVGMEDGGPALQAGFLIGDIITTWDGEPIRSVGEISSRLVTGSAGKTVKLEVERGGTRTLLEVTIGERPLG